MLDPPILSFLQVLPLLPLQKVDPWTLAVPSLNILPSASTLPRDDLDFDPKESVRSDDLY